MCWQEDGNEGIDNKAGAQYNNKSVTKRQKGGNSMRKIFALVLTLTLLTVPLYAAVATGVALSGMTDEELTILKQQLDTEILDRGMVKSATLPVGTYTVGVDIPQGAYEILVEPEEVGTIYELYATNEDYKNGIEVDRYMPLYEGDSAKITLSDGQILIIEIGSVRITAFSIQWQ